VTDIYSNRAMVDRMIAASHALDEAQAELETCVRRRANAEAEYRKAKANANAYLATSGTVGEREAQVDKTIADERYAAHLAEGLAQSALEAVRNRRTQLSVLQTVAGAIKEEMRFERTSP
jgi:hypothetical protein